MPTMASGSSSIWPSDRKLSLSKIPHMMQLYLSDVHKDCPFLGDKKYLRPPFNSLWFYEHKDTFKWTQLNTLTATTSSPSKVAKQHATAEVLLMSAGSISQGWGHTAEDTTVVVALKVRSVLL